MLRRLIALNFLHAALSLQAAEPPKPNTLTPKEIADGWLLLFDGETTFGWKNKADAKVTDGVLQFVGKAKDAEEDFPFASAVGSFELHFQYRVAGKKAQLLLNVGKVNHAYELQPSDARGWSKLTLKAEIDRAKDVLLVKSTNRSPTEKDLSGGAAGLIASPAPNRIQLVFQVPSGTTFDLRNIKLKPLELKPIFNGKDLAGWKEHPGKKSKFSVENGTIRIQNGPGDLQSEGQWDDFVLQLECKTNGNRLNSGIFFRCRPGEYQQGYEAQIHNGFGEPKEYTIEEYDPKTGKPLDKKKVKYTAMDYGTGAIYRRIPARKQMAKDNEWFTMTVIAAGRHMATWVNGVQVVDWTDNRPLKDNARNGCRLEKGPISFQGHDPTTDLNFRNIRIGELKK